MTLSDPGTPIRAPRPTGWYLPWVFLGISAVFLLSIFGRMNPPKEPYNLDRFARIPVVENGRVKPLESAARGYLRMISHREEFVDEKGDKQPAIQWYLDVISARIGDRDAAAWKHKVIRIENDQVLAEMKLVAREGLRYSIDEIRPQWEDLVQKHSAAMEKKRAGKQLDLFENKILELADRVQLILSINQLRGLDHKENRLLLLPPAEDGGEWHSLGEYREKALGDAELAGMRAAKAKLDAEPQHLDRLSEDQQAAVIQSLYGFDIDRLPAEMRPKRVQDALAILRMDPSMIRETMRPKWLEAVLALLPPEAQVEVRKLTKEEADRQLQANPAAADWDRMIAAYRDRDPGDFNAVVGSYRDKYMAHVPADALARARVEVTYDRFAPFYQCTGLYVLVFLLSGAGFILRAAEKPKWGEALRKSATRVLILTFIVHTAALITRMYLMDRWFVFVTNLYSSAIFIGLGCVALGLILERLYPIGIGNVLASTLGLATTIVAHNIASEDTLEMMQAVLDTNFWLSTHVTTVTLGYTATFVAGFLGIFYIAMMLAAVIRDSFTYPQPPTVGPLVAFGVAAVGLVTIPLLLVWQLVTALSRYDVIHSSLPSILLFVLAAAGGIYAVSLLVQRAGVEGGSSTGQVPGIARPVAAMALTPETGKILGQMIYGVVCFATLLSFVGTVLGGIWADQSWGRFWGWDPKENGAVLIVLWNALILHARWCGLVKDRGVAVLAIVGNIITAWSWFGTNQLGIGLHAYGFDTRLADGCANFWISMLVILGLGLIPRQYWVSATRRSASAGATAAANAPPASLNGHTAPGGKKKARQR
jgi:ABC-type transport system involved in cytochrome c biogenesis permease subunit